MLEKKDYVTKTVQPKTESPALAKRVKQLEDVLYELVALKPNGKVKKIRNKYK
ncbi:MAG: hypothetical protein GY841_04390 [FCB group bacterium]|nr:hypothetical protein [FCB group bacterium]